MSFKVKLRSWIESNIEEARPSKFEGLVFNLIENQGAYHIEFVCTDAFDMDDPDWACEEAFAPNIRSIKIPQDIHGDTYDQCIGYTADLLDELSSESQIIGDFFNQLRGVGLGFVDGDLRILREA